MKQFKAITHDVTLSLKQHKLDGWWQDRLNKNMEKHFPDIIGDWNLVSSWKIDGWNDGTSTLQGVYERNKTFKMCSFPDYLQPTCELVRPVFAHVAWEPVK